MNRSPYEQGLAMQGFKRIAGVDEAGRGPLAGPVVAAACVIKNDFHLPGVNDSKQLSSAQREAVFHILKNSPDVIWSTASISVEEIDEINILQATLKAMKEAVNRLDETPDFVVVDGNKAPLFTQRSEAIPKADSLIFCVAAASICAKVTRDQVMREWHELYPQYDFATHKGYGTPAHLAAIREHGPCPIHRRTFAPIKGLQYTR